ncbi:MAG: 6-hydroxymethylpterin diphosphokinase MptE-like protein [Candidatus Saliniplasma sp.]
MDYKEWKPIYEEILQDFGYSKEQDIKAAKLLGELRGSDDLSILKEIEGSSVEVLGPFAERPTGDLILIAGSSISRVENVKARTEFLVTDLDGDTALQKEKNLEGTTTFIHAHGDNIDLIREWSTQFTGPVISTCQCRPFDDVYNFGGFTDGDRCVFLADHFDAEKIILNGWDLTEPASKDGGTEIKKKKLRWASKLLRMVETPITFK